MGADLLHSGRKGDADVFPSQPSAGRRGGLEHFPALPPLLSSRVIVAVAVV